MLGFAWLATLGFAAVASAQRGPFGPIAISAYRSSYNGAGCPIEIIYTATINFWMLHPHGFIFNYRWERSDGAKGAVQVVRPSPNQRAIVVRETWRFGTPGQQYKASATLVLNSGNTHVSVRSPVLTVVCR